MVRLAPVRGVCSAEKVYIEFLRRRDTGHVPGSVGGGTGSGPAERVSQGENGCIGK